MTAPQPRHRNLAAPARFAARWRKLAACRGLDLNLFFPERGESAEPARQVCVVCPVRQPCLDYAISNRIAYGVWGGLTGRERRALQSRWVRASRRERDRAIRARRGGRVHGGGDRPVVRPVAHVGGPGPVP